MISLFKILHEIKIITNVTSDMVKDLYDKLLYDEDVNILAVDRVLRKYNINDIFRYGIFLSLEDKTSEELLNLYRDLVNLKPLSYPLNELNIKQKPEFNSGAEHTLYKNNKNSNQLYKVPKNQKIANKMWIWKKLFDQYPDLFVKIEKFKDGHYASVEKLNTSKVLEDLYKIWKGLENFIDEEDIIENNIHDTMDLIEYYANKKRLPSVLNYLKQYSPTTTHLLMKYIRFIDKIRKVAKEESIQKLDLHDGNIGIDVNGNLKMLDI